jgi:hypothetical protein
VRTPLVLGALSILSLAGSALAAGRTLDAEPMKGVKLRIDGVIKEWPGKMADLAEAVQGKGERVAGQIGYDDKNLYVAFDVRDDKLVRTAAAGAGEDHGTLLIAFPDARGRLTLHEIDLYPGDPGKMDGAVRRKGAAVAGAKIIEAPKKGGYTIEAQIPWSAFPQAAKIRVGMRAALRFTDADAPGSVKSVVGTSKATAPSALPPLPLEAEQGLDAALIRAKGLSRKPVKQVFGNVAGDGMLEHVAIYGAYLTIVGPRYRGGKQFYFGELGVSDGSMVTRLELADLDGDGKDDLILEKKIGGSDKYRAVLQVMKVGDDDTPFVAFSHETAIVTPDGRIENEVSIVRKGKAAIEISQGKAEGFEPDTYAEPRSGDMPSALLPWESVGSRTYQWDGKKFDKVGETAHKPKGAGKPGKKKVKKPDGPPPPPPPRAPTADELQDRLYALYRKERKVGAKAPRFDFVTDVAGDGRMERVLVHGNDVVVFGTGYRGGTSFAFITVGVKEAKDILHVTARDLTGDGKAEIIVRGVLHAKASKELGGDVVDRHALFIYGVTDGGVQRVFAAETGRTLGESSIHGAVAFVPSERGFSIELRPARAVGWTEKSYPFPADTTAAGGLEPLLLPWGGAGKRRYAWNGNAFAAR